MGAHNTSRRTFAMLEDLRVRKEQVVIGASTPNTSTFFLRKKMGSG